MPRVLVVEDEPNIAGIIEFKLRREGHDVRVVDTAAAVLEAAADFAPDLVLLDTSLDDGDALDLLDQLRARCPVIAMTEFRDERMPVAAREHGAAAVIGKPFKPTVLARIVAETAS